MKRVIKLPAVGMAIVAPVWRDDLDVQYVMRTRIDP